MTTRLVRPVIAPVIALAALTGLAACSDYGHRGYGYSRVSVGYGSGYRTPYYGWYGNYYYPGTGVYVYDRHGSRHRWSSDHRHYWEARRPHGRYRDNWSGYGYERHDRRRGGRRH